MTKISISSIRTDGGTQTRERAMTRVIRCGLCAPRENANVVRDQMVSAHRYRNDLVQIERGRRWAMRQIHDLSTAVQEAAASLRAATKSDRRAALRALSSARRTAELETRCDGGHWAVPIDQVDDYPYSPLYERERIQLLDACLRRHARALTGCYWGSYLLIEAAADQARGESLYQSDGLTPAEPRFRALRPDAIGWPSDGQIGVQLQGGLPTDKALSGTDSRVRLELRADERHGVRGLRGQRYRRTGVLRVRVGSAGRQPIWAAFPIVLSRAIPDAAHWKWVKISRWSEGHQSRWQAEITIAIDGEHWWRRRDAALDGAIAVELDWTPLDDGSIRAARWLDTSGDGGELRLTTELVPGLLKKSSDIQALRDLQRNDLLSRLPALIRAASPPAWLTRESATMHLWRSCDRLHGLRRRWLTESPDACPVALASLEQWWDRDEHLCRYQAGVRGQALGRRRDLYRRVAVEWSRRYRQVLVPDRDLSREARWGEDSDRRFAAAPQEFRGALANAFGPDCVYAEWIGKSGVPESEAEDAPSDWLEWTIERWRDGQMVEGARASRKRSKTEDKAGSKWSRRRAARQRGPTQTQAAREAPAKAAE